MIAEDNFDTGAFREWQEARSSKLTAIQYERNLKQLLEMYGVDIDLITDEMIENYVRNGVQRRGRARLRKAAKSSCVLRRAALIAFRKWMRKEHGVEEWGKVLDDIDLPRGEHKLPDCMTQKEIDAMLNAASVPREKCMYALLYSCGLRARELTGLTYSMINLQEREILVNGKGNKQRKCFLSQSAAKLVEDVLREKSTWNGFDYLFTNEHGHHISDQNLGKMFGRCAQRAGITRKVHPHMMRHSFATKLLRNGIDLMTIKEMMGHTSIATTQVYLTVENDEKRNAFRKVFDNGNNGNE